MYMKESGSTIRTAVNLSTGIGVVRFYLGWSPGDGRALYWADSLFIYSRVHIDRDISSDA